MITLGVAASGNIAASSEFPEGHPLSKVGEHWGSGGQVQFEYLLIAIGVVLVALSLVSLHRWWNTRDERPAPTLAFLEVCAAVGLSWGDRLFLWRIARQQRLPSPLTLMLCPITLHHHGKAYAEAVGLANRAARLRRVASLRRRLFAE